MSETERRNFRAAEAYYKLRQEKEIGLRFWLRGHKIVHVCRDLQINLPRSFGHPAAVVEAQQPWPLQSTVYCCCSRCKTFAKNWDNDAGTLPISTYAQLLLRNSKFMTENQLVIIKKVKKSLNDVCHISSDRSDFKWGYLSVSQGGRLEVFRISLKVWGTVLLHSGLSKHRKVMIIFCWIPNS